MTGLSEADRCTCRLFLILLFTRQQAVGLLFVHSLCSVLPGDIDQQMATDTRSYICTTLTDDINDRKAINNLQILVAACVHEQMTQFKIVSFFAGIKHNDSCSNLFVHLVISLPTLDPACCRDCFTSNNWIDVIPTLDPACCRDCLHRID